LTWARILNRSTFQIDRLFTSEVHVSKFERGPKPASLNSQVSIVWVSLHQKRECAASLNARKHTGDKKIDIGENLPPKHCSNR